MGATSLICSWSAMVLALVLIMGSASSAFVRHGKGFRRGHPQPTKNLSVPSLINEHCLKRLARVCHMAHNQESEDRLGMQMKEKAIGMSVLLTVPLAWGTYVPVVRYLYEIQPPVPGFVFSASYYTLAASTLCSLVAFQEMNGVGVEKSDGSKISETENPNVFPFLGGFELGLYLFLGNCLQVLGLKTVPSDRAGFLVQLTTVMVPLVQAAFAGNVQSIPLRTWTACLLAFSGVITMGFDGKDMFGADMLYSFSVSEMMYTFSEGDLLIVMAAFVYTLHVVRLGKYAKETTPLKLAASKATTEAVLSTALVVGLLFAGKEAEGSGGILSYAVEMGTEISLFLSSIGPHDAGSIPAEVLLPAVGAIFWTGLVTCAYTIYAQGFGQKRVEPTEANLIYSVQPLFTALFAWGLLGETLGPAGILGGSLIASAVYLVASEDNCEIEDMSRTIPQTVARDHDP